MSPQTINKKPAKKKSAVKKAPAKKTSKKHRAAVTSTNNVKPKLYASLVVQLLSLLKGEHDFIANAANFSALLFSSLPIVNWAGFYVLDGEELVLGPVQGNPACVRIPMGQGVCGVAAERCETIIVPNVHEFPGHIACDVASNSEIVIPLVKGSELLGVLDLDSPLHARFGAADQRGLEALAKIFIGSLG
jgi:GAF domain-containing protein